MSVPSQRHIPEHHNLLIHCHKNLSLMFYCLLKNVFKAQYYLLQFDAVQSGGSVTRCGYRVHNTVMLGPVSPANPVRISLCYFLQHQVHDSTLPCSHLSFM
jgi:hypothetical protein